MNMISREQIYYDIDDERLNQDRQWGGTEVDKTRSSDDWFTYIRKQVNSGILNKEEAKSRLVKVAALAVAALENLD